MTRSFPTTFMLGNITNPIGYQEFLHGVGSAPQTMREAERLMAEQGVRPASEYHFTKIKPEDNRQEITEKELGDVLREVNSVGTI